MKLKELFTARIFTISNFLSLLRVFLLIPLAYLMINEPPGDIQNFEALAIALVMVSTDFFDGWLARALGQESALGQYLDPIADKIAVLVSLFLLYIKRDYPGWLLLYIFLREVYGSFFGMFLLIRRNTLGKPNYWGKAGVFFIAISAIAYLMEWPYRKWTNVPVVLSLTGGIIVYWNRYYLTIKGDLFKKRKPAK